MTTKPVKIQTGIEFDEPAYRGMRAGGRVNYFLQKETVTEANKLGGTSIKTVAQLSHKLGVNYGEPLLVAMDALLSYAKSYRKRYGSPLKDDCLLGPAWLDAARGTRALLNGMGGVALENDISSDTKDNGVIEGVFWRAVEAAGYTESDV